MKKRIYLSGAMSGVPFEEQMKWRMWFQEMLGKYAECFNPPEHFSDHYLDNDLTDHSGYKSDREVMNFDLAKLRESDIVVVNFDRPNSLGTMAEIAIAYELRIPIYGFGRSANQLHPWQRDMCERIFATKENCLTYLVDHWI